MAASVANSDAPTDEKAQSEQRSPKLEQQEKPKKGLFRRSHKPKADAVVNEKAEAAEVPVQEPAAKQVPPVSFAALFR